MYILCASHIDSERRCIAFQRSIESVKAAYDAEKDTVMISASCSRGLEPCLHALLDTYAIASASVRAYIQPTQLSQFQHYAQLAKEERDVPDDEWCMFFDDDDYSHPCRFNLYRALTMMEAPYIVVYYAGAQKSVCDCGAWEMPLETLNEVGFTSEGGQEYFMFAVRMKIIRFFCKNVGDDILAMRECDLMFRSFLRCLPCMLKPNNEKRWLYAHTKVDMAHPYSNSEYMDMLNTVWRTRVIPRLMHHPMFNERKHALQFYLLLNT